MDWTTLPWRDIGDIALAALLGALIGIERDLHSRPAGMRTNIIIAVSSCLFTILSIKGFPSAGGGVDVSRVASQIVVGVGFLGAGAMIRQDDRVLGLTTAADIWLVAAIGMSIGVGLYALSTFVTLFTIACLVIFAPMSRRLTKIGEKRMKKRGAKAMKEH